MNGTTTTDNEPFDNGISGGSSKRRKGRKGTNKSTKSNQSTKSTNDLTNRSKRSRNRSTKSKRSQRDKSDKKSKETATSQRDRQSSRDTAYSKRRERNASQTSKTSNRSQREYLKTWLCDHVGLPQYYDCFVDHGVEDFGMVTEITINELKLMGVHTKKHQLQIQKEITKLRNSIKARKSTDGSSLFDTVWFGRWINKIIWIWSRGYDVHDLNCSDWNELNDRYIWRYVHVWESWTHQQALKVGPIIDGAYCIWAMAFQSMNEEMLPIYLTVDCDYVFGVWVLHRAPSN